MSIKASSVSRYLGAKGFSRSESCGPTRTTGYRCEDTYDFNHRPCIRISWIPGDASRTTPPSEVHARLCVKVREMYEALSVRYNVTREKPDNVFGGDPYLMVTSKEESTE